MNLVYQIKINASNIQVKPFFIQGHYHVYEPKLANDDIIQFKITQLPYVFQQTLLKYVQNRFIDDYYTNACYQTLKYFFYRQIDHKTNSISHSLLPNKGCPILSTHSGKTSQRLGRSFPRVLLSFSYPNVTNIVIRKNYLARSNKPKFDAIFIPKRIRTPPELKVNGDKNLTQKTSIKQVGFPKRMSFCRQIRNACSNQTRISFVPTPQ